MFHTGQAPPYSAILNEVTLKRLVTFPALSTRRKKNGTPRAPSKERGDIPIGEGPAGTCTNGINEPGVTYDDGLHFVTGAGYYGGHPNPTRANLANTFNGSNPQSPVTSGNSVECDYQIPGQPENGSLHVFSHSTNGMDEYRAGNFAGQLAGQILTASFNNVIYRIDPDR